MKRYMGWIAPLFGEKEKEFLQSLGIQVGPYDYSRGLFDPCVLSDKALAQLDPWWQKRFVWTLHSLKTWETPRDRKGERDGVLELQNDQKRPTIIKKT